MSQDEEAFAAFFEASWDPCTRAVLATTGDLSLAEEQVAEAFARAWSSWPKLRNHPALPAWIVRTALNVGASRWRKRRRELPLAGQQLAAEQKSEPGAVDPSLLGALGRLPRRQREVVVLRLILDLDVETTADQLGLAPGTVRAHLSRAIAALRGEIAKFEATKEERCSKAIS